MKNVLTTLGKKILIHETAAASAIDAAIQKKLFGSGATALEISNKELDADTEIVKTLEKSGLLIKGVSEAIELLLLG